MGNILLLFWNLYHDRENYDLGCGNGACFNTSLGTETEIVQDCLDLGCYNGVCVPPECFEDSDCESYEYCEGYYCVEHFPENVTLSINNQFNYSHPGELNQNPVKINNFEDTLNNAVYDCNLLNLSECIVPIFLTSDTKGRLTLTNINIFYDFINCFEDSECGEDYLINNSNSCDNNSVFIDNMDYSCAMAGTIFSHCVAEPEPIFQEQCDELCYGGECVDVECFDDSECGTNYIIENSSSCNSNNSTIFQTEFNYLCLDQGTVNATCTNYTQEILNQTCDELCYEGECVDVECFDDSGCGTNYFIPNTEDCYEDNIYFNFISYSCLNPGTFDANCTNTTDYTLYQECDDSCLNGSCIDFACYEDSDCGDDYFVPNTETCYEGDVYVDLFNYQCNLPGTVSSSCTNQTNSTLSQTCEQLCINGTCENEYDVEIVWALGPDKVPVMSLFKIKVNISNNGPNNMENISIATNTISSNYQDFVDIMAYSSIMFVRILSIDVVGPSIIGVFADSEDNFSEVNESNNKNKFGIFVHRGIEINSSDLR